MQKIPQLALFLTVAAITAANAQYADPNTQGPARPARTQIYDAQPGPGVSVRSDVATGVQTVTSTPGLTEIRVVQGRADVTIHHPADHSEILVDLPGGQISLLKDGLYTFNAATNTVRVLRGEAQVYNTTNPDSKGAKVKETQQLAFFPNVKLKAVDAYEYELTADLLPLGNQNGEGMRGDGPYNAGPYGDGFYAGGYGYPYGYGYYPYAYGYPFGFGLGFGYYGGFGGYRGGFGGYRGGFRR